MRWPPRPRDRSSFNTSLFYTMHLSNSDYLHEHKVLVNYNFTMIATDLQTDLRSWEHSFPRYGTDSPLLALRALSASSPNTHSSLGPLFSHGNKVLIWYKSILNLKRGSRYQDYCDIRVDISNSKSYWIVLEETKSTVNINKWCRSHRNNLQGLS